jgi:hypothetical protein
MGIVIPFPNRKYSLAEAKRFLGNHYFKKALFEWSLEELERMRGTPTARFFGSESLEKNLVNRVKWSRFTNERRHEWVLGELNLARTTLVGTRFGQRRTFTKLPVTK